MNESNELLPLLITLLVGGIIGFVIYHLTLGKSKTTKQQKELDENKAELEKYKAQVNDHFNGSAELMGQVASSYQALYDHMASQSQTLLSDAETTHFPLLKTSDNTESEVEATETKSEEDEITEIKFEDTEIDETEVKFEKTEADEAEVKFEETEIAETEVKSEADEIAETEVKSEEAKIIETEAKSEETEIDATEAKSKETK